MTGVRDDDQARSEGIALDSLPKWLRDLIDINNEFADRDTGRAKRFLASSAEDGPDSEKKKEERQFNALMRLLQDPEYARLYTEAANMVSDIEDAAAWALEKLEREGEAAAQKLDEIKDSAATLPDGRKVFLGEGGKLYAEDGSDVTDQKDSVHGLSANTARFKDHVRAREVAEDIERRRREVEEYQRGEIERAKRRLADPDNPPSKEELEDIMRRASQKMPPDVRLQFEAARAAAPSASIPAQDAATGKAEPPPANSAAADELVPAKGIGAPDLFAQFRSAGAVVSNADPFAPQPTVAPKVT